jgi:predicted metal-dependent phosphoesterase TrpH
VLERVRAFRRDGIDGVECFYVTHNEEQTRLLAETCAGLGLLRTGSSDFHGPGHRVFSRFRAFSTYGLEPALGPLDLTDPA